MSDPSATGNWVPPTGTIPADRPTVAGYEIIAELGRGGMGVVYKARQTATDRLVALKLIRDGALASRQDRERFRIEAEAAGRMRHPNIVHIYETGEHNGLPFFAMELVEGGSLDRFAAGRPLPPTHAAELVRTVALAVQHAHEQKIIHRDLKPANILLQRTEQNDAAASSDLCPPPADLSPKVTDFGLAKRLDSDSTAVTQPGAVLGTARYMAPEQAAGRAEVGAAVDVYALGAILYELLTGRAPFDGDSWNQTIQRVLNDEPVLPTRLHADVPPDLEVVCLKCLEKDPARRYATAAELADELGRFLESKPVAAAPPDPAERLTRVASRDGYQLVGEIGRGPRGTVYRALHGPLKQPVVLKVFAACVCTQEEWDARLKRSAELWVGLAHPHIVPVQRAGWWDGAPYLIEEYVPQGNLAAQLGGRPQPVRHALKMIEQLAEVVSYIHRQGASHGNLKPTNVLLAADGIPRLVDFRTPVGLFPHPRPTECDPTGLAYLAPELIDDPTAEPRPHTDIYGLGVILYELLTGCAPFSAATAGEMLEEVRRRDPEPPSRFNRDVTQPLELLCLRCLQKNPWRRYSRAYDVLKRARILLENPDAGSGSDERKPPRPPGA
jgi:serine/threonine protein kinase